METPAGCERLRKYAVRKKERILQISNDGTNELIQIWECHKRKTRPKIYQEVFGVPQQHQPPFQIFHCSKYSLLPWSIKKYHPLITERKISNNRYVKYYSILWSDAIAGKSPLVMRGQITSKIFGGGGGKKCVAKLVPKHYDEMLGITSLHRIGL